MFFYTSNTPAWRATNEHLKRSLAHLGCISPTQKMLRTTLLDDCHSAVMSAVIAELNASSVRYPIVSDGWSKRIAIRGSPLINFMICPDNGAAVFWRVQDASGQIKDAAYVVKLHEVRTLPQPALHSIALLILTIYSVCKISELK